MGSGDVGAKVQGLGLLSSSKRPLRHPEQKRCGFNVQGLRCRVWGLGFRLECSALHLEVKHSRSSGKYFKDLQNLRPLTDSSFGH